MQEENYNMPPGDDFGDGGDVPEAPKKHKLSFGHPKEQAPDISGITNDINSLGRRLRLVEEASANVRNMVQITEENMISKNRMLNAEIKTLASEINDIKKDIHDVKDKVFLIIKELQNAAKKEDVKLLEKYINMWNPVRFVTKGELDYVVEEIPLK
ncbi:hypothetical protein HYU10_03975 [Candidatus Woesearchaeota archaeon]|nr:hypothetical protein [Candidatus Woesearchaeota archaeon]